jgi:hypothetical protein
MFYTLHQLLRAWRARYGTAPAYHSLWLRVADGTIPAERDGRTYVIKISAEKDLDRIGALFQPLRGSIHERTRADRQHEPTACRGRA